MDSRSQRQLVQQRTLCVTTLIGTLCGSVWLRALALLASVQAQAAARESEAYAVGAAGHLFAGAYGARGSRILTELWSCIALWALRFLLCRRGLACLRWCTSRLWFDALQLSPMLCLP